MAAAKKKLAVITKTVSKKPKKVKAAVAKESKKPTCDFNFWELSNKLEELSYKIENLKNVLDLIQDSMLGIEYPAQMGALSVLSDTLEEYYKKLEVMSNEVMDASRKYGPARNNLLADLLWKE